LKVTYPLNIARWNCNITKRFVKESKKDII
jgi:hypothetical protein